MSQHLNWGIMATGNIAHAFARGLKDSKTGKLVAVGSRSAQSAEKFGAEFDVPNRHASYEALLADPEVQAVYISTPHPHHAEWAIKAAEAGKHILCEKPLTIDYPSAMAVAEAAISNKVLLCEAFMYRCHPQTTRLVELLREGVIGEVGAIRATFSFHGNPDPTGRHLDFSLAGGGILDVGSYGISMSRLIAGVAQGKPFAEPTQLKGCAHLGETGVDAWAIASLKFPGDILAQVSCGVLLDQDSDVRVYGSEGSLIVPSPWFCGETDGQVKIIVRRRGEDVREEIIAVDRSLYAYEADVFFEGVQRGEVPHPAMSATDALGNMRALDRWRKEIGLQYPQERVENLKPASGRAVQWQESPKMKYGRVNGLDKPVSKIVLGTMLEGAVNRTAHGFALFDNWIEHGGNCFDTAHIYGSESIVGQWLKSRGFDSGRNRNDLVIIGKGAHTPNCDPENLTRELHLTLEALQVEGVDIYMMHRDNPEIPVGEFVDVLNQHHRAGRMTTFGGSNWSLQRIQEANEYAAKNGLIGFSTASNNFSLARMVAEVWKDAVSSSDAASRDWFAQQNIALFAWSSQARGFFVRGARDFTSDSELTRCWYSDDNFARLERVHKMAEERGVLPINIAAAYVLNQPFPIFALIGPQALSEIRTSLPALEIELSPDDLKWLNLED